MRPLSVVLAVLCLTIVAAASHASPIVSIDTDPNTAGIQSTTTVDLGSSFLIDIVISGVDVSSPLNGFELDVLFDPSILLGVSVVDGGFLLAPTFVVQAAIGVISIEFAELTLLPTGASGSGVLAIMTFNTVGVGTSVLDLENVILAAPFGVSIPLGAINDGSVAVVPEPSAFLLFSIGALVARASIRDRLFRADR